MGSVVDLTANKESQMDPNECLKEIRATAWALDGLGDLDRGRTRIDLETRLVNAIHSLDNWLCHGGFLPVSWSARNPDIK